MKEFFVHSYGTLSLSTNEPVGRDIWTGVVYATRVAITELIPGSSFTAGQGSRDPWVECTVKVLDSGSVTCLLVGEEMSKIERSWASVQEFLSELDEIGEIDLDD